jgi:hypothetical protein
LGFWYAYLPSITFLYRLVPGIRLANGWQKVIKFEANEQMTAATPNHENQSIP